MSVGSRVRHRTGWRSLAEAAVGSGHCWVTGLSRVTELGSTLEVITVHFTVLGLGRQMDSRSRWASGRIGKLHFKEAV